MWFEVAHGIVNGTRSLDVGGFVISSQFTLTLYPPHLTPHHPVTLRCFSFIPFFFPVQDMPALNTPLSNFPWAERTFKAIFAQPDSVHDSHLTPLGIGNFITGLAGMWNDGLDGVSIHKEHPTYIKDMATWHEMRGFLENTILDLVSLFGFLS